MTALPAEPLPGTDGTPGAGRIRAAFAAARAAGRIALVPYVVAGYPDPSTSLAAALAAVDAGADLLEIGLPFSDPLADGPTLQRAAAAALRAGATFETSLRLIEAVAARAPGLPLVPMGYANQLAGPGDPAARLRRLVEAGASGCIVADLTPDEGAPFEAAARAAGLGLVYLVAPTTPPARRIAIARRTGGFLYCVSLVGVTGARSRLPAGLRRLVGDVVAVSPVPVAVGFGVSRERHVVAIAEAGADGVVVASALVDALGPEGRDVAAMGRLVARLAAATRVGGR
ncbi:MAG TPA: tryptophan synthase subunit alpha [Candidatus Binatia bacterium]|nr:tryptophan synthase subunit alpha [Candidatus Binatia bacterium]